MDFAWPHFRFRHRGEFLRPRAGRLAQASSPVTGAEASAGGGGRAALAGLQEEHLPRVEDLELPVAVPARAGRKLRVSSVCWDAHAARAFSAGMQRGRGVPAVSGLCLRRCGAMPVHASCRFGGVTVAISARCDAASRRSVRAGQRATAVLAASGLRMTRGRDLSGPRRGRRNRPRARTGRPYFPGAGSRAGAGRGSAVT